MSTTCCAIRWAAPAEQYNYGNYYTSLLKEGTCQCKVSVRHFSKIRVADLGKFGLKWVAVARIGLKLGGNEATRFRIIFKPDFYIKKCLVGVTLG